VPVGVGIPEVAVEGADVMAEADDVAAVPELEVAGELDDGVDVPR
jgi:hypothetical protein